MAVSQLAALRTFEGAVMREGTSALPAAAVCTRDRPDVLRRALSSLHAQSLRLGEVLVIDNAQSGERDAARVAAEFRRVRYIREHRPGLDVARNRALAETRCGVLMFLDDDAVADRDWALRLFRAFEDPAVAACTGRVEPWSLVHTGQRLFEANGGFGRGLESIRLPGATKVRGIPAPMIACAVSMGSGCSLAVRREVVRALGGFDEALDTGEEVPGGGDHDMLWRLVRGCHTIVYEPESLAWHEHRADTAAAIAQIAGHQKALIAFLRKSLRQAPLPDALPIATFLAWRLLKPGVRLVRRAAGRDPLPARALLNLWAECWRGLVVGSRRADVQPRAHARVLRA